MESSGKVTHHPITPYAKERSIFRAWAVKTLYFSLLSDGLEVGNERPK